MDNEIFSAALDELNILTETGETIGYKFSKNCNAVIF
jgi:hypothetical protein